MVSFCIVVSIFLISIYEINEYKLSLSYYFFVKMQEKDFFDRMKTTNKRLNLCFIAIHHSMRALRPKNPENITNFPGSFASAQDDECGCENPLDVAASPLKGGKIERTIFSLLFKGAARRTEDF